MPRPTRASRPRRGAQAAQAASTSASDLAAPVPTLANIDKVAIIPSDDDDIYGISDREVERQRRAKKDTSTTRSRSSRVGSSSNASVAAAALSEAQRDRDAALSRLDDLTTTTDDAVNSSDVPELGRKDMGMESSLLGREAFAMESSLLGGSAAHQGNLSGMEINDSEIFGNLDSSFEDAAASAKDTTGSHSGTRSADTSTFNVSVFRRQPGGQRRRRQSSIVSKDDAPIRPSSRGPTTPGLGSGALNLGNFRRRQRQPSILLSSAQKANLGLQRPNRAASAETENAVAVESDVEESFLPEAEGTPVRVSRGGRKSHAVEEQEGDEAVLDAGEGGRETRSKKRKSTESHDHEAAKRQAVDAEADAEADETVHKSVEIDAPSSPLSFHETEEPSSPPSFIMRSIQRRRAEQEELDSDILAPPADSDDGEGTMWPSLKDLGKKRHGGPSRAPKATPALEDDMSDLSDPPSLTHSPNFKATKPAAKNKRQESPKLSTADLEALLPRRRRKSRRDPYNSENQENSASEQEEPPRRAAKKKPAKPTNGTSKTSRPNAPSTAPPAAVKRTTRRTYGSRRFDKEDTIEGDEMEVNAEASTPLDDTAFEADVNDETTTTLGLSAELKAASRKFKEVDKWELEFEEVVEPSSDLPEGR